MSRRFWRHGAYGWIAMAVAMSANGIVREIVIKPRTSEKAAGVISAATGIGLIQLIAWLAFRRARADSWCQIAALAAAWLLLTLGFEFSMGLFIDHKSWQELVDNYNIFEGRLWPVVLTTVVAAPFIWAAPKTTRR